MLPDRTLPSSKMAEALTLVLAGTEGGLSELDSAS